MKLKYASRRFTYAAWTAVLGLSECIILTAVTRVAVISIDEPPCFMRTQDGRMINLQSLCTRTTPQPIQSNPTTNQPIQRPRSPQAYPPQVNVQARPPQRDPSGSHANGNPDSDDGLY